MLCSEACVVNSGEGEQRAITLYCNSWNCDICQPRRQRRLIALAKSGNPDTFLTLTAWTGYGNSRAERAQALVKSWRTIVKRAKKRYGYKRIPYLCIFEGTKAEEPHLHILLRCKWLDQRWLSDQMRELMQSPIVDIRRVKSTRQAAQYVAKYVGKEPEPFAKCKRYWTTRDYDQSDPPEVDAPGRWSPRWKMRGHTLTAQADEWISQGYAVFVADDMLMAMKRGPQHPLGPWLPRSQSNPLRREVVA